MLPEEVSHFSPVAKLPSRLLSDGADTDQKLLQMREIEGWLLASTMSVLERAWMTAKWVEISQSLARVSGQLDQKRTGRPRSGIAEAARMLPFAEHMSGEAKRQQVQRDLRISRITPTAQEEARAQKLDNNQTALLAIAAEKTEEAQVEVARTWKCRNVRVGADSRAESYEITGLDALSAPERHRIDRVMAAIKKRYGLTVVRNPSFPPRRHARGVAGSSSSERHERK